MTAEAQNALVLALAPKKASTGSVGFQATEKVVIDGKRYQGQASAWLIGSKGQPDAATTTPVEVVRAALTTLAVTPKNFSTGKAGFYGCTKITGNNNERYQASVILTEIK